MLFGGLLCGLLSDRIGRKPCLQYSLLLNAIAGVASAGAPDINWLIVFRVIGGIGIGGSVPSVFTLGAEIFPADIRGKLLSVVAWLVCML
jgi:MFS transporter, putative metabolite:H+ symporter